VLPETIFQSRSQAKCRGLSSVVVAEWIEQIQTLWTNGAESRLELASLISTIRNHLRQRRGDWSSLWESGEIPFSKRKAEKLVVVGDGLGWAVNANACSHLPTEWNALYDIAKLGRSLQQRLIDEREIRPTLTVGEARDLFARFHGVTLNRSRKTRFRERLRRFEDFFLAELPNCSQAEKDLARATLTGLVERIDVPVPYLFSVAAGILPAVEPGILPGGMGAWFEKALPLRTSGPGGKMPPSTAAKMAAATDVRPTLNRYPVPSPSFPVITPISLLEPVLKLGGAGDSPAPVGDPPTGTAESSVAKRPCPLARTVAPRLRPTSRRTAQAGRLCYQQTIFQTRS
jgi:hypothetical protein